MGLREFIVKKENRKPLIIGSSIVAGLLVVGIGVATFALSNSNGNSRTKKVLKTEDRDLGDMNYEEAIAQYMDAIALDPTDADAYVGLAEVYAMMGEKEQAEAILDEALEKVSAEDIEMIQDEYDIVEEIAAEAVATTIATTAATTVATTEATTVATTEATTEATTAATTEATTTTTESDPTTTETQPTETVAPPADDQHILPMPVFDEMTNYGLYIKYVSEDMATEMGFSALNRLSGQVPYNIDGGEAEPVDMTDLSETLNGIATYWFGDVDNDMVDEMIVLYYADANEVNPDGEDIAVLKARIVKADDITSTTTVMADSAIMMLSRENTSANVYSLSMGDTSVIVLNGSVQGAYGYDASGAVVAVDGVDYELFAEYEAGESELENAFQVATINFAWGEGVDEDNQAVIEYGYKADELVDTSIIGNVDTRYHDVDCQYTIDEEGVINIQIDEGIDGEYAALAAGVDETFNSQDIHGTKVSIIRADSAVFSFVVDFKYGYSYDSLTGEMITLDTIIEGGAETLNNYIASEYLYEDSSCDMNDGAHSWVMNVQGINVFHLGAEDNEFTDTISYSESIFRDRVWVAEDNYSVDIMTDRGVADFSADLDGDGDLENVCIGDGYYVNIVVDEDPWDFEFASPVTLKDARYISSNGNDYVYVLVQSENGEYSVHIYGFEVNEDDLIEPIEIGSTNFFTPSFTVSTHDEETGITTCVPFSHAANMTVVAPCDFIDGNVAYSAYVSGDGMPATYSDFATPMGEYYIKAITSSAAAGYVIDSENHDAVAVNENEEYLITGVHSTEYGQDIISAIIGDKEVRIAIDSDEYSLVFTSGESTPNVVIEVTYVPSEFVGAEIDIEVPQVPLSITFNGAEDGVYYNASSMSFSLNINTEDPSMLEDIYYVVKIGDAVVSQGEAGSIDGTLYVNEITDGLTYLPNGTYEVTFYNSAEELISVGTVEVVSEN